MKRTDPSALAKGEGGGPDSLLSSGYCKTDVTPFHGVACAGPNDEDEDAATGAGGGPPPVACGTSGILYASVVPVGARLVGRQA